MSLFRMFIILSLKLGGLCNLLFFFILFYFIFGKIDKVFQFSNSFMSTINEFIKRFSCENRFTFTFFFSFPNEIVYIYQKQVAVYAIYKGRFL